MAGDKPVRDADAVGKWIGVAGTTVLRYLGQSRPGGSYSDHPFPEPYDYLGRTPYWLPSQEAEVRAWDAGRPGRGAGGGRPRKVR